MKLFSTTVVSRLLLFVTVCAVWATPVARSLAESPSSPDQNVDNEEATKTFGRPVRVVTLSFLNKPVDEVLQSVDEEGAQGADIIALPETWTGKEVMTLDGPIMQRLCELAKKHRTYIVNSVYRQAEGERFNSAILIDREGRVAGIYDKVYPHSAEFDAVTQLAAGKQVPIFETDFGKLGLAICFDANFPELWSSLADQGAELVIWPSAYWAGRALQAHAINHHYYIVTSTWRGHCLVYDITGDLLLESSKEDFLVTRITLDLDRRVYHGDFNWEKAQRLINDHPDEVELDKFLHQEHWFILKAKRGGVNVLSLAKQYGLEEHRDYVKRSRTELNRRRGDVAKVDAGGK